jgi:Protein of unknown function (DUF2490)
MNRSAFIRGHPRLFILRASASLWLALDCRRWLVVFLILAAASCGLVFCADPLRAQGFDQLWPEVNAFLKLNDNSRLFFLYAGTRVQQGGYSDGQLGAHVDLFLAPISKIRLQRHPDVARNRFLSIRLGYLYGKTPEDSPDPFVEHTPTIEITPRYYFPKGILVTNRNREDFRFLDGVYTPRYRNRLKVERSFQTQAFAITPYAHAEAFYDRRFDSFHRFRFAAGGEIQFHQHFVVEGYYLRQQDPHSSPRGLNVAGVGIQFYFP